MVPWRMQTTFTYNFSFFFSLSFFFFFFVRSARGKKEGYGYGKKKRGELKIRDMREIAFNSLKWRQSWVVPWKLVKIQSNYPCNNTGSYYVFKIDA